MYDREKLKREVLLYAVTDSRWCQGTRLEEQIEKALKGGISFLQLREKELSQKEFIEEGKRVLNLCRQYKVPLVINDDIEVAKIVGAEGVHLGQSDDSPALARKILGNDAIIGLSASTVEEAVSGRKQGADYIGAGAVFHTATKNNTRDLSEKALKSIVESINIPVVAIGGINENNMELLGNTGISGVALVSAVFSASDIEKKCRILKEKAEKIIGGSIKSEF